MTIDKTIEAPKEKKKAGRPKVKFTPEQITQIEDMALIQCKTRTIAEVLGIDEKTLEKHCSAKMTKKRAEGRVNIHKAQLNQLSTPVMAIWLGKQHLEQADKQETKLGADIGFVSIVDAVLKAKEAK